MPREVIQSLIVLILLIIIPHIIITILKTVVLQRRLERQLLQLQPVIDNQETEKLVETILNQLKSENLQIKNEEFEEKLNGIRQAIKIAHQKRIGNKRAK
jgi:predicted Holliday junction resolvase-like endonuclease